MTNRLHIAPIDRIEVSSCAVPTDAPESDGTLEWSQTTLVLVRASAGKGIGYTYADTATASLIHDTLSKVATGTVRSRRGGYRPPIA